MKCLNREDIQFYIDEEMDTENMQSVHLHLSECEHCRMLYEQSKKEINRLHELFESLNKMPAQKEIPAFIYPVRKIKIFMKPAAACIAGGIIILFSMFHWQSENVKVADNQPFSAPLNEFPAEELDPNQQFQKGKMELNLNLDKLQYDL